MNSKCYIDIKSEELQAIILQALENDNNASAYIREEGITMKKSCIKDFAESSF